MTQPASVFGKSSKITLGLSVPTHSGNGMLPPTLHLFQSWPVRFVAAGDHFFQMAVFGLYDLIGGISMELEVTGSTQLFACHCFHKSVPFLAFSPQRTLMAVSLDW
jgi:hypothetical protein